MSAAAAMLLMMVGTSAPVSATTDFGIRAVGGGVVYRPLTATSPARESFRIDQVASVARKWGRVTSTLRTPEHNRRVGGVANSYHLRGLALDVARSPGVTHAMIEAHLRQQDYRLIESLDEGDHSHFAFATSTQARQPSKASATLQGGTSTSGTAWRIVAAPR